MGPAALFTLQIALCFVMTDDKSNNDGPYTIDACELVRPCVTRAVSGAYRIS